MYRSSRYLPAILPVNDLELEIKYQETSGLKVQYIWQRQEVM